MDSTDPARSLARPDGALPQLRPVEVEQAMGARERSADLGGQLLRFIAVGLLSAAVDLSVYTLSVHLGLWLHAARALSFLCGTTTAYLLNRRWAFRVEGGARRAASFALLYSTTFLVILAVNALGLAMLPDEGWALLTAWAISQGFGTAVNFVMLRLVIFRD